MGAVAVAMQERGFKVTGSGCKPKPTPADVELPREQELPTQWKGHRRENIPVDGDRQRDDAWQPGSGGGAKPETTLSVAARGAEGFLRGRHNLAVTDAR